MSEEYYRNRANEYYNQLTASNSAQAIAEARANAAQQALNNMQGQLSAERTARENQLCELNMQMNSRIAQSERQASERIARCQQENSTQLANQARQQQQAIVAQQQATERSRQADIAERNRLLDFQRRVLQTEINSVRSNLLSQIEQIEADIRARNESDSAYAYSLISEATNLLDYMRNIGRPDLFVAEEVANARRIISDAERDADARPQAAIATARQAIRNVIDARYNLELAEVEWSNLRLTLGTELASAEAEISVLECERYIFGNETNERDARVDFWSFGRLNKAQEELNRINSILRNEILRRSLSICELNDLLINVDNLNSEIACLREYAKRRYGAHIHIVTETRRVSEALANAGWVSSGQAIPIGGDERNGLVRILTLGNGDRVSVQTFYDENNHDVGQIFDFHIAGEASRQTILSRTEGIMRQSIGNRQQNGEDVGCNPVYRNVSPEATRFDADYYRNPCNYPEIQRSREETASRTHHNR